MKTFLLLIGLSILSATLFAQSGDAGRPYQRTRGMSTQSEAYDLPYLTVKKPYPQRASDQTHLIIFAPDSVDVQVRVKAWMTGYRPLQSHTFQIGPGRQELPIPLQALSEGPYTIEVLRREQVVAIKHIEVFR